MTSTNFQVGYGENSKNSSKVLKPPGGGTSDIFGGEPSATPRSIKNHMASNIFTAPPPSSVSKNGGDRKGFQSVDSHNRLFGEPERPYTPAKNHLKSNIPIGGEIAPAAKQTNGHAKTNGHNNHTEHNGKVLNGGDQNNEHDDSPMDSSRSTKSSNNQISPSNERKIEIELNEDLIETARTNRNENYSLLLDSSSTLPSVLSSDAVNHLNSNHIVDNNIKIKKIHYNNNNINNITNGDVKSSNNTISSPSSYSKSSANISPRHTPRNPVTGFGIDVPIGRPRKMGFRRDGNPVTGEGYKPAGAEINTTIPALNGANQVINKNRIPPGGFSSGLW